MHKSMRMERMIFYMEKGKRRNRLISDDFRRIMKIVCLVGTLFAICRDESQKSVQNRISDENS